MAKVLHCRTSASFAGPERQIRELARALPIEGFKPNIVILYRRTVGQPTQHPLVDEAQCLGVGVVQIVDRSRFSPGIIGTLIHQVRTEDVALIHTHDYKANLYGLLVARLAGVATVATVHLHTRTTAALRLYQWLDLIVLRRFNVVIAVSEHLRRELLMTGLAAEQVVTIHNAIDSQDWASIATNQRSALRQTLSFNSHHPVVSIVGRLSPQKGQRDFLISASQVLAAFPETWFLVVGDGPDRSTLQSLAVRLGIADRVCFLNYRTDVGAIMTASDVITIASVREGLPYVLLEALALGRPIVATCVGGIPEVVHDGQTGLLVPPRDPAALARAIIWLLDHPTEAAVMGQRGRERVLRDFSAERMARETAAVYREVLRSK